MSADNTQFIAKQVQHWLNTPAESYLGSSFGENIKDYLQTPNSLVADGIVAKMRKDCPALSLAPNDAVSLISIQKDFETVEIAVQVYSTIIRA